MSGKDHDPQSDRHAVLTIGRGAQTAVLGERTQIIVPISAPTREELAVLLEKAASSGAHIVEWRADTYLAGLVGSHFVAAAEVRAELDEAIRFVADTSALPVLATIRTSVEGGSAYLDDREYCELVESLAFHAGAVDVEIEREGSAALIGRIHEAGALAVASYHDFSSTPDDERLAEVLAAMNHAGADVLKFACMAHSAIDAARVLSAQAWAHEAYDRPVIGIAMGASGAPTRLVGSALGSAATFASLSEEEGSAPGQFTIGQALSALEILEGAVD